MFYTFVQNNSGGYNIHREEIGISDFIIIEAPNSSEAIDFLNYLGSKVEGFYDYCSGCGERWLTDPRFVSGDDAPSIWGTPIEEIDRMLVGYTCFIHCQSGEIKKFKFRKNGRGKYV